MSSSFTIDFTETVTSGLAELARRGGDLTPAMAAISRFLASRIQERFRTETAPDGTPWKPSLRVTGYTDRHGKRHDGDGGQTLTLHADLRRSIREDFGADYASAGPEASGAAAVYAAIHQFSGTIRPRAAAALRTPFGPRAAVHIPAREYLGFYTPVDAPEVIAILGDFLTGELA